MIHFASERHDVQLLYAMMMMHGSELWNMERTGELGQTEWF